MQITINELRHDTRYFFYQQIRSIFFISVLITFINLLIDMFIKSDIYIISIIENNKFMNTNSLLELIDNMNLEEKHKLLKYSIFKMIESLMSKTVLLGSIILLISTVSKSQKKPIISSIYSLFSFLPSLFILNFLNTVIIQIGFMLLTIPGIFLSITLSLSPIIFSFKKHGLIDSMYLSMSISWKYIKIIGPSVLLWIFIKFIVTVLIDHIYFIDKNILCLVSNITMNILFSILIIYLFRFYMIFLRS